MLSANGSSKFWVPFWDALQDATESYKGVSKIRGTILEILLVRGIAFWGSQ